MLGKSVLEAPQLSISAFISPLYGATPVGSILSDDGAAPLFQRGESVGSPDFVFKDVVNRLNNGDDTIRDS